MRTVALRVEHRTVGEPALGLGTGTPRLSWQNADAPDGFVQVSAEVELTRTRWGGQASTETVTLSGSDQVLVAWPVAPLVSRERAVVRVRATGADGSVSHWSDPAVVEAWLLGGSDWAPATFVTPTEIGGIEAPAPALVASFDVPGRVTAARLHITAHGWY